MYQVEHNELFKSIRDGKPINDLPRAANSVAMAIGGRMAAYTGQTVTWDALMKSKENLQPEKLEWGPGAGGGGGDSRQDQAHLTGGLMQRREFMSAVGDGGRSGGRRACAGSGLQLQPENPPPRPTRTLRKAVMLGMVHCDAGRR
jgi:hypothetical protein